MFQTSKTENIFAELLTKLGLKFNRQYKIGAKYYDFYLPDYNILIEIDGDFWHGNPNRYKSLSIRQLGTRYNDRFKDFQARISGKRIIRFWASELNNKNLTKMKLLSEVRKMER